MLFDPVVFENLKVAMENQLYDLDNLDRRIAIIGRQDLLDLAVMSRSWSLNFTFPSLLPDAAVVAEIQLMSSIKDLSDEILQREGADPSCHLQLAYRCPVKQPAVECPQIEQLIHHIWQRELLVQQHLTACFGETTASASDHEHWMPIVYENKVTLSFSRRINEEQMEDIEALLEHAILTLEELVQLCYSSR